MLVKFISAASTACLVAVVVSHGSERILTEKEMLEISGMEVQYRCGWACNRGPNVSCEGPEWCDGEASTCGAQIQILVPQTCSRESGVVYWTECAPAEVVDMACERRFTCYCDTGVPLPNGGPPQFICDPDTDNEQCTSVTGTTSGDCAHIVCDDV